MLGADQIAEPRYSFTGVSEIAKLPFAVKRGRVPNDVIVDVSFISMGTNNKSVFTFEKARCKIIADLICFFR